MVNPCVHKDLGQRFGSIYSWYIYKGTELQ